MAEANIIHCNIAKDFSPIAKHYAFEQVPLVC